MFHVRPRPVASRPAHVPFASLATAQSKMASSCDSRCRAPAVRYPPGAESESRVQLAALVLRIECADRQEAQLWWQMAAEAFGAKRCRVVLRYVRVEATRSVWEGEVIKVRGRCTRGLRRA